MSLLIHYLNKGDGMSRSPRLGRCVRRHGRPGRQLVAAGLCGAAFMALPAAAADVLPAKSGPSYVKACTAQGEGFLYLPGTDTCIKIGGYAWAEGYFNTFSGYPSGFDKTYTVATYGLQLDTRNETEYGTLRSYFDIRFKWRTSEPWADAPDPRPNQVEVWNAYVQFAGFTFGHAQSFFDFYANADVLGTDPGTIGSDVRTNLAAYTVEFGKGFSATLAFEDASERQSGVFPLDPTFPDVLEDYQAGQKVPDVVANLAYEGTWGKAQVSGALHQVNALDFFQPLNAQDTWGYALQAGIMFKLPVLGEGDTLYLQTAYADGAIAYLGLQDPSGNYSPPDAFVGPLGLSKVSGWNVTGSLKHNWNEKWSSAVFGGYAAYSFNDSWVEAFYGASGGKNANVGGNIAWTPVSHLQIALQYDYNYNSVSNYWAFAPAPVDRSSTSASQVLLFVARDF